MADSDYSGQRGGEMKDNLRKLNDIIGLVQTKKDLFAKERDKLADLISDLYVIKDSFDIGIEEMENGINSLNDAIDEISQYV